MYRKWKSVSALGMAALLGCLMPMGTMLAAEENTEVVQEIEADSASDTEAVVDDEAGLDENENVDDEVNADNGNADDEINADDEDFGDEVNVDDENVDDEAIADDEVDTDNDANDGIEVMSEAGETEAPQSTGTPVINIELNGQSCKYDLGGEIVYSYVKGYDQRIELSASRGSNPIEFYYYIDKNPGSTALKEDEINWTGCNYSLSSVVQILSSNTTYVIYVKTKIDESAVCARSCGIVVDNEAPEITGIEEGKPYPEGTTFEVSDANLESVTVNEKPVTPAADGKYQVTANGTSCVIKAKDKAGNEKTCSITVFGKNPAEDGVISANGTYALNAGTSYKLAEGKWQVGGDSTVYQGGSTFYVTAGNYSFTKR